MNRVRKGEGAAIDFFAGDRMVRGVRFPKMSEGRKVGWPLHPSPAGRVGAYRIRPPIRPPKGGEGLLTFKPSFLSLMKEKKAKENQGARGAGQPSGILKMTGKRIVCWGHFVCACLILMKGKRAKENQGARGAGQAIGHQIIAR